MALRLLALTPMLALVACADPESDEDADGLKLSLEWELGSDPSVPDSDGDGLLDGQEYEFGLDPLDPADAYDTEPYEGGWPRQFVPIKDQIEDGKGTGRTAEVGKRFPRMRMKDQFGDEVDLYDLAGQGKKILIDISAEWCGPCNALAEWMEGVDNGMPFDEDARRAVTNGDVYWVTILGEDAAGDPAKVKTSRDWYAAYPNEAIPILADAESEATAYAVQAWPMLILVNQSMTITDLTAGASEEIMDKLAATYSGGRNADE